MSKAMDKALDAVSKLAPQDNERSRTKFTLTLFEQILILNALNDYSRRSTDDDVLYKIDELIRKIKAKQ